MSMPELTEAHAVMRSRVFNGLQIFTVRFLNLKEAMESDDAKEAYTTGTVLSEQEYSEEVLNKLEYLRLKLEEFRDELMATMDLED